MLNILNFIVALVLVFFTILIFHPTNRYKLVKSKEEQLFLQKTLITTIFNLLIIILITLGIFGSNKNKIFFIELLLFNIYIITIVLYNYFLAFELFSTFSNPVHYFNRLFKQQRYNYLPECIIFAGSILTLIIDFFTSKNKYDKIQKEVESFESKFYCYRGTIFIIIGIWKSFVIIILSISSLVLCYKIKTKIQKFCFKNQEKLYDLIGKRITSNYLYIIYGIFYTFPIITSVKLSTAYNIFGVIFFIIIILNDFNIHISIISTTKFCEYRLKKTFLQYFCSFFYKPPKYTSSSVPLVNESSINEVSGMTTFQNETTTALEIITKNPKDKELVSIYKSGIFIEDYFFYFFDQILNIITASIFHVYNSKYFSTQANEQRLSTNIQIGADMSSIGGTMQNFSVSNFGNNNNKTVIGSTSEVGEETTKFDIIKNMEKDDLHRFKEVLENDVNISNNNNFLNISIKSYFTTKCVESIYEQKLKGKNIGNSLLSHMILTNVAKNKNKENPNAYFWSLLAANGKEEYFNKLKNTNFKTYDKNYNIDIFDTDDSDLNTEDKNNNQAVLLDKYFTYIHGKGIKGTFIPLLVGVFKIKINNFKTLLVLITRNSFVENVPKNFFTYWQLIRFLSSKPQKMASSQFNAGSLVKDDPIFERSFQIETKKENPNYNKIAIKNYIEFDETIEADIEFLRNCGSLNFDLLLMYYEYENTQKHEKQGAIKIRQTNTGTEIIEESLPKGGMFDDVASSPISKPDSLAGGILSMGGEFFDDNDFGGKHFNPTKQIGNLVEVDEKVNISGYEGVFDSFSCLCFFTFENVFDIRKRVSITMNYYKSFKNKIMSNFTEYKNK